MDKTYNLCPLCWPTSNTNWLKRQIKVKYFGFGNYGSDASWRFTS
ncbi:MAG: hypothetical protein V7641_3113 [Blastocatellia bacterium]